MAFIDFGRFAAFLKRLFKQTTENPDAVIADLETMSFLIGLIPAERAALVQKEITRTEARIKWLANVVNASK
jgi:uncharacterized small protein (DUF1192 family)